MIDEALEHLVKGIVDNPEEVVITEKKLSWWNHVRGKSSPRGYWQGYWSQWQNCQSITYCS